MNVFCGVGRLVNDPELKYTPSGVAVCSFRMAFRNPFQKDEQGRATSDFFDVTAWRELADFASGYLGKGREVAITGRLRSQSWKAEDGSNRSRVYIQAERLDFVGPKPEEGDGSE